MCSIAKRLIIYSTYCTISVTCVVSGVIGVINNEPYQRGFRLAIGKPLQVYYTVLQNAHVFEVLCIYM